MEGANEPAAGGRPQIRLGDLLLRAKAIDEAQLEAALAEQRTWGGRLGRILVDLGFIDERTMSLALARQLGLPCIDLAATKLPANVTDLLSVQACERLGVMPLGCDPRRSSLRLATSDPTNGEVLEEVARLSGLNVEPVVTSATDIDHAVRRYYYGDRRPDALPDAVPGFTVFDGHNKPVENPREPVHAPRSAPQSDALELAARVERLEQLATRQARALRVLVEILVEQKMVDRESFQRRARGERD